MANIDSTWMEYLAALQRLDRVVKKQTIVLQRKDFVSLTALFGQKENAILSLQRVANQLPNLIESEKHPDYSVFKQKVREMIEEIQKTETVNKDLLVELMEINKKQSQDLNEYSDRCKSYLSSVGVKQNGKLNVVT